jgi:hypothetical protein
MRKSLKAVRRPDDTQKRELWKVNRQGILFDLYFWFADDRTFVVGGSAKDLEAVSMKPREGIDHLSPELTAILKERLGVGTPTWLVGQAKDWDNSLILSFLFLKTRDLQPLQMLTTLRTFGIWFQFGDGLTLNAAIQCADEAAAKKWEAYLTGREGDRRALRIVDANPRVDPIYQELARTLKSNRHDGWVTLQARASSETMNEVLGK